MQEEYIYEKSLGVKPKTLQNVQNVQTPRTTKIKLNYTNEMELKSLLIRINNRNDENINDTHNNKKINKYIKWYVKLLKIKYKLPNNKRCVKNKLKNVIIRLSEQTLIDDESFEKFGEIILLMIKNILRKPQFSSYTYRDEFYSDAVYKILKYSHNFNHNKISKITFLPVSSFAYISQIIHMSILYIINTKKSELEKLKKQFGLEHLKHNLTLKSQEYLNTSFYIKKNINDSFFEFNVDLDLSNKTLEEALLNIKTHYSVNVIYAPDTILYRTNDEEKINNLLEKYNHNIAVIEHDDEIEDTNNIFLVSTEISLYELLKTINDNYRLNIYYPEDYVIEFDEYNKIKHLLDSKMSIMRKTPEKSEVEENINDDNL